jgi:hypothetical protein
VTKSFASICIYLQIMTHFREVVLELNPEMKRYKRVSAHHERIAFSASKTDKMAFYGHSLSHC